MRKRTWEEQEAELEHLQQECLQIIKDLIRADDGDVHILFNAHISARKLLKVIERRERTDRCYYCGSEKRELGTQRDTGLTQCVKCGHEEEMERYQSSRNEYWRRRAMDG